MSKFYCRKANIPRPVACQVEPGKVLYRGSCKVQCKRCSILEKAKESKKVLDDNIHNN